MGSGASSSKAVVESPGPGYGEHRRGGKDKEVLEQEELSGSAQSSALSFDDAAAPFCAQLREELACNMATSYELGWCGEEKKTQQGDKDLRLDFPGLFVSLERKTSALKMCFRLCFVDGLGLHVVKLFHHTVSGRRKLTVDGKVVDSVKRNLLDSGFSSVSRPGEVEIKSAISAETTVFRMLKQALAFVFRAGTRLRIVHVFPEPQLRVILDGNPAAVDDVFAEDGTISTLRVGTTEAGLGILLHIHLYPGRKRDGIARYCQAFLGPKQLRAVSHTFTQSLKS